MPAVPSLPRQYAASEDKGRGPSPARGPGLTVDINALRDPSLRPEQCQSITPPLVSFFVVFSSLILDLLLTSADVAGILSDASEQDINEYQQTLMKMRNRTLTDLQQNVYQNRTQFIKISKEAEKLKGEMGALRNLMSELKSNTTALRSASSQAGAEPNGYDNSFTYTLSKKDKRSSVADRSAMWNSQLQVRGHPLSSPAQALSRLFDQYNGV